jgi:hypothetical protein
MVPSESRRIAQIYYRSRSPALPMDSTKSTVVTWRPCLQRGGGPSGGEPLSANIPTPLHRLACLKWVLPSKPIPMLS